MIGKSPNQDQKHLFLPLLTDFIDPRHELYQLAHKIDWQEFETEFAPLYSTVGCPAKPVRLMVGLLILKQIYDLGDETVMQEWVSNPYFQYFCGEATFQWQFPCDPSDLVHFRHRIKEAGVGKILAVSILIHGKEVLTEDVSIDRGRAGKHHLSDHCPDHQAMPEDRLRGRLATAAKLPASGQEVAGERQLTESEKSQGKEQSPKKDQDDRPPLGTGTETET